MGSSVAPVHAAGETIISTFYVPLFEDNARAALFAVNSGTGTALSSTTSVTVGAEAAIIYYDHWEDGYEPFSNNKTQTSTLVLGDGNTANGNAATYCVPARCAGDYLPAGAVLRLNNSATVVPGSIATPRTTGVVVFDGRDKIAATEGLAVTHATWPTAIDALHSEMAAAFDTSRWGVNFSAPVGVNTPAQGSGTTSFGYTGLEVMASEDNTSVSIDVNNDGDFTDPGDHNGTIIDEGETVYVNGNVREGAEVLASDPVQVFMMTGVIGSNYEDRSFQVFPTEGLVNDYVAPASTARGTGAYATVLYIFNPQSVAIDVDVTTSGGTTTYSVPAGQTLNPAPFLAANQAARLTAAQTFAVVAGNGTRETSANSLNYDWGYSPLPARLLVDDLVVGWAPGSQNLSNPNYDPIWATAVEATTLYVDYDADPTTGANVDSNGQRYDTTYTISTALAMVRITDSTDNDMTGARVYTVDGVGISLAYGEDPASTTPVAFPGVDLGTTQFPACGALCVQKEASMAIDLDGDGLIDPGDTIRWIVTATNTDYYALEFPVLLDILPPDVSYLPGTATVQLNNDPVSAVSDDVVPPAATLFPYDESGRQIVSTLTVGSQVTVTFDSIVDPDYAGGDALCNRALVTSQREIILTDANGADTSCVPVDGLRVTKTSDTGGNPVVPGQTITYTIGVDNQSSGTLNNIAVVDTLPAGLTWVSTNVTRPADISSDVADDMEVTGNWTGDTGTALWSASAWTETDSQTLGTGAGRVRKAADGGDTSVRWSNGAQAGDGISRVVGDLSAASTVTIELNRRCESLEADDAVELQVRPNGSAAFVTLDTWSGCDSGTYSPESYSLTSAQFGTATEVRFRVVSGSTFETGGGVTDRFWLDDVVVSSTGRVVSTVAGSAPPTLYTLTDLLVGESATVVVVATVNNPYTATDEITNIVTVRSGNTVAQASVIDCVRCFDYGDAPASFEGAGPDPARARATSTRTYIADTFQDLGYAGSTGTVAWAGDWVESDTSGGGATGGLVQNAADAGTRALRIGSTGGSTAANNGATRAVGDLSAASSVTLTYDYRCTNLGATDVVQVQMRPNASAAWSVIQTINSCNNATIYSNNSLALTTAEYGTATELRVIVTNALETGELLHFDDVQIRAVYDNVIVGPRLGTAFDRETGGTGTNPPFPATAPAVPNGDDTNGTDDEDGVAVPAVDVDTIELPITITDTTGGVSYVNGWMDWDNDGIFQSDESVFAAGTFISATGGLVQSGGAGAAPGPGTYTVTVQVPNLEGFHTLGGTLYSRFRVATELTGVASANTASLDGEVEDYASTLNTLPVDISYFGSRRNGNRVTVSWHTAQEIDNLGFNVYAQAADGSLTRLTRRVVPSSAPTSATPQQYQLKVSTRATQLWLEDISLDGVTELHGPYTVGTTYGDPNPPAPIDWTTAQAELDAEAAAARAEAEAEARADSQRRQAAPASPEYGPVADLTVAEAGIQQVTYDDLLAVGVDLAGVPSELLALTSPSGATPIEVVGGDTFGPGSAIRFLGEPLDTLYSDVNVYRLHIDPALAQRIRKADPTAGRPRRPAATPSGAAVTTHAATVEVDDNVEYSITAPGDDPWYDELLVAIGGTPATANATVTLDQLIAGQPVTVAVDVWGITRDPIADEHHVRLEVNGVPVAEDWFDNNDLLTLTATVDPGVFVEGANTLEVVLVGDSGVFIDMAAVNSWTVTYTRSAQAQDGRLDATVSGARLDVTGVPAGDVVAYRIGADGSVGLVAPTWAGATLQLPGSNTNERFVVSAAASLRTPAIAPARPAADLLGGSADYLIISHGMFVGDLAGQADLTDLVAHHEGFGRTVKVVDVADVYAAYSNGVVDAAAIDAYLADAVPALGLTWVLLVGADSFDYRDFDEDGSFSLLPSLYGATGFSVRFAPLDPAYADTDGDGVPDVALGRLPARTPAELEAMVTKTLAYAASVDNSLLLVSDGNDGIDYAAVNDTLEARFPGWDVERSDVDRDGVDGARTALLDSVNGGVGLTFYLGHSSAGEWTEVGLLDAPTAAGLANTDPTVILQFGCWNTYYVAPDADTLAHAFLLGSGDATGVAGSTTLTSSGNDIQLAAFIAEAIAGGASTLGEAVLIAKRELARHAAGTVVDVQLGWTILGDPAIPTGGLG